MSGSDLGPSWNDCAALVGVITADRLRSCEVRIAVALPRVYGKGYSAWTFLVRSEPLQGRSGAVHTARSSWGSGGAWKTAPAALHRALSEVVARLEADEQASVAQARF